MKFDEKPIRKKRSKKNLVSTTRSCSVGGTFFGTFGIAAKRAKKTAPPFGSAENELFN